MRFSASTVLVPRLPRRVVGPASSRRISQRKHFMSITLPRSTIKVRMDESDSQGLELQIRHVQLPEHQFKELFHNRSAVDGNAVYTIPARDTMPAHAHA